MELMAVLAAVAALGGVAVVAMVVRLIEICPPNAVLIFSGTTRRVGDREVGYKLVQGGRKIRIPLLETVNRLELTNMIIDLRVKGAYSRGGIPLNVEGVANIKIASQEPAIGNAIERFLGKPREEIMRVARETLEGNLRGVLATLTPEEVNQDRVKFAQTLLHEADHDLNRLGLELDTLKIQHVSDDVGYLDSLGRKQTAGLLMRSRVAEAENQALAAERTAENLQNQESAKADAELAEARAEAARRVVEAQSRGEALVAEEQAAVTALVAKAEAELAVQRARIEQVRLQLQADRIKVAEARKQEAIAQARGHAARIVEDGKATAEAIAQIARTWQQCGAGAREIVVAQKLSTLVQHLMSTVSAVPVDKVTFIDAQLTRGDGLAVKAAVTSEQLKHTLGLDLPGLLRNLGTRSAAAPAAEVSAAGAPADLRAAPPAPR
jgi:flotillin